MCTGRVVHREDGVVSKRIAKAYRWWAHFVSRHVLPILITGCLISLLGGIKIYLTPFQNDISGYTPLGSRSLDELKIFENFFQTNGSASMALFLLIVPLDGGSILRKDVFDEIVKIEKIMTTEFYLPNHRTGKNEPYSQFCRSFCMINEPLMQFILKMYYLDGNAQNPCKIIASLLMAKNTFRVFAEKALATLCTANGYTLQTMRMDKGDILHDRVNLEYPISTIFSRRVNIQPFFYGVTLDNNNNTISNMKEAKMCALTMRGEGLGWTEKEIGVYEYRIFEYFTKEYNSSVVRVLSISATVVEQEIIRTGLTLLPYTLVAFTIMYCTSTLSTFLSAVYMGQLSIYKLSLAFFACLCPFMACGTALGFMFLVGFRFASILCVTPFLVLAIGIDDAYLMIHAWQRIVKEKRKHPNPEDTPADRLAEVLCETGPAILISALTNIFADMVGTYTGAPEVILLAYANMLCIFVDFLYQITFYSAIMIVYGRIEMNWEKEQNGDKYNILCNPVILYGHANELNKNSKWHDKWKKWVKTILETYINLLTNVFFNIFVLTTWLSGLAVCIVVISRMEVNLTPTKLFAGDSPLQEMGRLRDEYIIPYYFLTTVLIQNPGDLSDKHQLEKLEGMVHELEAVPYAWGENSTIFFLKDFEDFVDTFDEEPTENVTGLDLDRLEDFTTWPEYKFWKGILHFHQDNKTQHTVMDKFILTTAYHGQDLKEWPKRNDLLKRVRDVAEKYKDSLNASIFMDDALFLDLIDNMPVDMWQAAGATLLAMALVCLLFLQDVFTTLVATVSIATTMAGILGILGLFGTYLDPIVMAALIISIGFSVDIPAHVSFHYHTAEGDVRCRLRTCLTSVGLPAIQASCSTGICVLSLLHTQVYMAHIFVKAMFLCIVLCLVNGLLIIPCSLHFFSFQWWRTSSKQ